MKNDSDSVLLCKYISSELNSIRNIKRINLQDVSADLGLSVSYLRNIESGQKLKLSLSMYAMLAMYYDVSLVNIIRNARIKMELDDTYRIINENVSYDEDDYEIDKEAEEICKKISLVFKSIRKEQKLLAEDVSFDLDISSSYFSSIENGNEKKLSLNTYVKLAAYYDIPFDYIVEKALTDE